MSKIYIGVDVSKGWLDMAIHDGTSSRIDNTEEAISAFIFNLKKDAIGLIAFEPTGGYERVLRQCLQAADIPFFRVHPNEVVAFRARRGVKAKTDAIDARLLADFAAIELSRRGLSSVADGDDVLRELVARRRQLADLLHAERCRASLASGAVVKSSLESIITFLKQQLDAIEDALAAHIAASPAATDMAKNLRSLKGVGPITVYTLLGELPELGRMSGKEIAALVGLAPQTRQSGKRSFRASTGHGRHGVRSVLFNAARTAIVWNPTMKAFYERLVTENKRPGKVALIAVMRKMLVTLNAIAREKKPWKQANA